MSGFLEPPYLPYVIKERSPIEMKIRVDYFRKNILHCGIMTHISYSLLGILLLSLYSQKPFILQVVFFPWKNTVPIAHCHVPSSIRHFLRGDGEKIQLKCPTVCLDVFFWPLISSPIVVWQCQKTLVDSCARSGGVNTLGQNNFLEVAFISGVISRFQICLPTQHSNR